MKKVRKEVFIVVYGIIFGILSIIAVNPIPSDILQNTLPRLTEVGQISSAHGFPVPFLFNFNDCQTPTSCLEVFITPQFNIPLFVLNIIVWIVIVAFLEKLHKALIKKTR